MKKATAIIISILALLVILVTWVGRGYNTILIESENATRAWADVEANNQRRADLIPNLVQTVQAAGVRESKTLTEVTEARTKAQQVKIDASNLTEQDMQKFLKAQGSVTGALSRLIALKEDYPQLKSNESFLKLQRELESTENRIAASRYNYNKAAQEYNRIIRIIPYNIAAMITGFKARAYFKADEGAQYVTQVKF